MMHYLLLQDFGGGWVDVLYWISPVVTNAVVDQCFQYNL